VEGDLNSPGNYQLEEHLIAIHAKEASLLHESIPSNRQLEETLD